MSRFAPLSFSLIAATCSALFPAAHAFAQSEINPNSEINPHCVCSPEQTSKAFTAVAKKSIPAVVFIKVQSNAPEADENGYPYGYQNPYDFNSDDFFNRFFGMPFRGQPQKPQPQLSQGSGFLVSSDGYIMTNAHVVKGADKITAVLNDGREMDATLVGSDPHTDIAIIKIEGKEFPFLTMGDSEEIDIGEWVIAIGSPFQLEASVTVGVVSAKGRQNLKITNFEDFIQTDAAINPGNSGGPLFNLRGQVVGINTAIVSRSGGYMGIGFAIPSNMAKNIMAQIIDKGSVTRGFLGVSLQPVDKDIADAFNLSKPEGALISEVTKDSPADKANLKQGDIILEYNKLPVKSLQSFRNEISLMNPGTSVNLKINRKGQILNIPVTLGTSNDALASGSSIIQKLGMEIDNLTPDLSKQLGYTQREEGVVISKIKPGSAAAMAGLRPGFLIQAVNHKKVANVDEFNEALGQPENKRILLLVRQGNATRFYSIKVD
jgi:serine protease Do